MLLSEYTENSHLLRLKDFFSHEHTDLEEILLYGLQYLPNISDSTGNKNLDLLNDFTPQVVAYYEILGRLSFLPHEISDLCTDLSLYANGESIELDTRIYELSPKNEIEKTLARIVSGKGY